ncbi:MAG: TIGR04282 family arsenosugar biosynthesis glycosyltransferase [Planctomycetes bacterium]|nr:TIGR04282 family arsenosugar biosynthesis glycosyltransferase [Planctomycetota bacterium]
MQKDEVKRGLILFAKAPLPGLAKTRLGTRLSDAECAALAEAFIRDTAQTMRGVAAEYKRVAFTPPEASATLQALIGPDIGCFAQAGGDLGDRLLAAFERAFAEGCRRVLILGTDTPTLPASMMDRAFESLRSADLVLGPSTDGGYYLIGLRRPVPALFQDIPWGTEKVLERTLDVVARESLSFHLLPPWYDVDTPEQLDFLLTHLRALELAGAVSVGRFTREVTMDASPSKGSKELIYEETFARGPGAWTTGKNLPNGSWHRNIFGQRGGPMPLGWHPEGGPGGGGYAYAESPWYFDDNHGEFMWLYLAFFLNRSSDAGLAGRDLRGVSIEVALRGSRLELKGAKLYFWIQGLALPRGPEGKEEMYNWALASQPIEEPLLDGGWREARVVLDADEARWSCMGLLNGGLARKLKRIQTPESGRGSLLPILGGRHVNLGFLLCGVDPCDPPTGRIDVGRVTFRGPEGL